LSAMMPGPSDKPASLICFSQEVFHIVFQTGCLECLLNIMNDCPDIALAVTPFQYLSCALIELHHTLRIEQHIARLRIFPLHPEQPGQLGLAL
jgi:hypothetical protein